MENATQTAEAVKGKGGMEEVGVTLSSYLEELGERIFALRKASGMSQQTLADSANLDRTYISAVEHGKQNVTIGAIVKLSTALKIPLKQLLVE